MIHKKLLSLLVLLMTAASGAWAEVVTIGDGTETTFYFPIDNFFNYSCTEEIYTADEIGTKGTIKAISFYYVNGTPYVASNVKMFMKHVTRSVFGSKDDCEPLSETDVVWTGNIAPTEEGWFTFTLDTPFEYNGKDNLLVAFYDGTDGHPGTSYQWRKTTSPNDAYMALRYYSDNIIPDPYNLSNYSGSKSLLNHRANIKLDIEPSSVEISDDMTEATFTMPAFDATVNYDIVRDMADTDNPVEFSGLSQKVIVKKKTGTGTYEPLSELNIQLIDQLAATDAQNIISADGIKVNVLKGTDNNGTITYDETNPIKYADFLDNMQPGLYKIVAEPTDATTSPYTGTASLAFEALAGYPVDVAANEYVTYYSATENLTVDDEDAQLYTITAVSGSTATAEEISGANKEMPFLVYNSSDKDKTIILIPTDVVIAGQAHASEFVGTATATTIAASTDGLNNYAFNGKKFVWVMEPLPVAANKAWLAIPATPSSARTINLVFGDATAIGAVSGSPADNGDIYDLNGRKLDKKPTRKGVYIQNGRKVVIK